MKKYIYTVILFFVTYLIKAQTETENYTYTTQYQKEYKENYANFSIDLHEVDLLDYNGQPDQVVGSLSLSNNVLNFSIQGNWSLNYSRLKIGVIKDLSNISNIPDMDLGELKNSLGESIGYLAKIFDNKLIFETNVQNPVADINSSSTIGISQIPVQHIDTFNNIYECFGNNQSQSTGEIIIGGDYITLNVLGQAMDNCYLNLGPVHNINVNYPLPEIDLGFIRDSSGNDTPYKAKIEQNWVVFYLAGTVQIPDNVLYDFTYDFGTYEITDDDKIETVTYYDGLGRLKQTIIKQGGGNKKDIISPKVYDSHGRLDRDYLPYSRQGVSSLNFEEQNSVFFNTLNAQYQSNYPEDIGALPNPYAEKDFENSPLNRVLEQASPGKDWALSSGNTIKFDYLTNESNEVKLFSVSHPNGDTEQTELVFNGYYNPKKLYKKVTKDENHDGSDTKNHTTEEFTNKNGKVILKRTYNENEAYDTYYVYDNYDNLTYVLPPEASDEILSVGGQGFRIASQTNYPWVNLVEVDKGIASEYNKKLADYENENILNADITNKYGGQGGYTVTTHENDLVTLSISFSANQALALKQGELFSLKAFGEHKDTELGRISGIGYEYTFYIKNNAIVVNGKGLLPALNETFSSNTKLVYNQNYPWTKYIDVSSKFAYNYEEQLSAYSNSDILNVVIDNQYGGQGGINVSIDENDIVSINLNSSTTKPLYLKKEVTIPLNMRRRIADREVGEISGNGYHYKMAITNNTLVISGSGPVINFYGYFTSPPPPPPPTVNPPAVQGLCYIYHYDDRNRLVEKKIPGRDWEYIVYDKLDHPILTQDAKMRINNDWIFTKYDAFGRIIYTGKYHFIPTNSGNNSGRLMLQDTANNQVNHYEVNGNSTINGQVIDYTKQTLPSDNLELYTVNYYDNYNFSFPSEIAYSDTYNATLADDTKSLLTGTKVRVLGTNDWITSLTYYDEKRRPIFISNKNEYLNTVDIVKTKLSFLGTASETESIHTKGNNTPIVIKDVFTYDHAQRLLTQTQSINNSAAELIVSNNYDELGKLERKKVGGIVATTPEESVGLQTVDYDYNIRGWLRTINDGVINGGDLFGFKLNYNTKDISSSTTLFNGNINEAHWVTASDNKLRSYSYGYDNLNRILNANYFGNYVVENTNNDIEDYGLNNIVYDKNGNISALRRTGLVEGENSNQIDVIDDLIYNYSPLSNTLTSVNDTSTNDGFKDGNNVGNDYEYDSNGNMIIDKNKGITSITYNHLNLPERIIFNGNDPMFSTTWEAIEYKYSATGVKLEKTVKSGGINNFNTSKTKYAGVFIYKDINADENLKFFNQPEGYVEPHGNGYRYVYQYKDHLGNIRLSYSDYNGDNIISTDTNSGSQSEIVEENNFYPFGLKQKGYNNIIIGEHHPYGFGGKEEQNELGLGWIDITARNYDPALGRWMNIDPLAETMPEYSPYTYAFNNPVYFLDPDGAKPCPNGDCGGAVVAVFFHGGPFGGGKTTTASKGGDTGKIYNQAKTYAESQGREFKGTIIAPGFTSASGVNTALQHIIKNLNPGDQLIVYGYSYGVDVAVDLTQALDDAGIDVDLLLITVDGSDGPLQNTTVNTDIPANVDTNLNVYQDEDSGTSNASSGSSSGTVSASSSGPIGASSGSSSGSSSGTSSGSSGSSSGSSNSPGSNGGPNSAVNSQKTNVINKNITGKGVNHGNIQSKAIDIITSQIQSFINSF